jgi:UDP-N-acetylmuramoyl-L-alanyl-D-glutamate--2,6-diaminopimelate ligase
VGLQTKHSRTIVVNDLKQSLGAIAHDYYGKPSEQLACVGVTGTNGKTTVTHCLAQLLEKLQGKPSALLGTLGAGLLGKTQSTGLTTPHASDVQRFLAQAVSQGAGSACIEATSIGMDEGRLNAVAFTVAAFTNLTQDHLDYHGTMAAYGASKKQLFDCPSLHSAVINADDAFGSALLASLKIKRPKLKLISIGFGEGVSLRATDLKVLSNAHQTFTIQYQGRSYSAQLPALGKFNVENALTALACCIALGYELAIAIHLLPTLTGVAGRMQIVSDSPLTVIDFAHTPDGLEQALQALQPVASARAGKLHVVFGCGGNRDATKRALMGAIAQQCADEVTVTSDNPRDESPSLIAGQIAVAAPKATIELDRAAAIAKAIHAAKAVDVVLIAGKGHETTQTVAGVAHDFSDFIHAQNALNKRNEVAA